MCLSRSAHGLVPNHPIFRGPLPVDLRYEARPTPDNYKRYVSGAGLPDTLQVWQVDQADYTTDKSLQPGTVSNGYGFTDSPDAEVVAGGINSKAHNSVALGRHGSLFLWGFASAPSGMTPSGRNAFVNTVCYIRKFDHQPRQVRRVARDRGWALESARFAKDEAKVESLRQDLEFLRPGDKRDFLVDEDCKALGRSNRSVALLEACIDCLAKGQDTERATRLLERYTGKTLADAAEWRTWLTAAKPRLFFSDVGGYRWFLATDLDAELRQRAAAAPCPALDGDQPMAATVMASTQEVRPGEVVTLAVRLRIADGWHAYGDLPADSPYRPVKVECTLPAGWTAVGRVTPPATQEYPAEKGVRVFTGDAVFLQRVRVAAAATPGEVSLGFKVGYMVCDEATCLPPAQLTAAAAVRVLAAK
jgi:hypothetical protein